MFPPNTSVSVAGTVSTSAVRKLLEPLGVKVSFTLSQSTNYLIANPDTAIVGKVQQAKNFNIPIVSLKFFEDSIEQNCILPTDSYRLFTTEIGKRTREIEPVKPIDLMEIDEISSPNENENSNVPAPIPASPQQPLGLSAPVPESKIPIKGPQKKKLKTSDAKWREAKVFISSTFRDMHGERDHLTKVVFPELQDRCNKIHVHVTAVDLRWGVTEAEAESGATLKLCLDLVDQCRPLFIGLLGERYGWIPNQYVLPSDDPRLNWVKKQPPGMSITHLEMEYGMFLNGQLNPHGFVYVRDTNFIPDVPVNYVSDFLPESPAVEPKMAALKEKLSRIGVGGLMNYPCSWQGVRDGKPMTGSLEVFGNDVLERLWGAIQDLYPAENVEISALQQTREHHDFFIETHSRLFVGRGHLLSQMRKYVKVAGIKKPLIIKGFPGSGKTSLVATFARRLQQKPPPNTHVLSHFIGGAPGSTLIRNTLQRLCQELYVYWGIGDPSSVPAEYSELETLFSKLLSDSTPVSKKVVIVIDALNQFDSINRPWTLNWCPVNIRDGVSLILSTLPGVYLEELQSKFPSNSIITVGPLGNEDQKTIVNERLSIHGKKLTNSQMDLLLQKSDADKPLFLTVACEELRVFGVFEKLTQHIREMASDIPSLFQQVIKRLETDFGEDLVRASLSVLACARGGLYEDELRGILGIWDKGFISSISQITPLSQSQWNQLERGLREYLRPAGEANNKNRIDFFHEQLLFAIKRLYLDNYSHENPIHENSTEFQEFPLWKKAHTKLAEYFRIIADPQQNKFWDGDIRGLSEVAFHLITSRQWNLVLETMCDLSFIESCATAGLTFDLLQDFILLLSTNVQELFFLEVSHDSHFARQSLNQAQEFHQFIKARAHIMHRRPDLTFSMALSLPDSSFPCKTASHRWNSGLETRPHIRWINKPNSADPCLMTLSGHNMVVQCCAVNPNFESRQIASASHDLTIKLWDSETGEELASMTGHTRSLTHCAYSPDGRFLVSSAWDKTVRVWNLDNFQSQATITTHSGVVLCCCFSPCGRFIASSAKDGTIAIHSFSGDCPILYSQKHSGSANYIRFSPSGNRLIVGLEKSVLVFSVYAVDDNSIDLQLLATLTGHLKPVNCCIFGNSEETIITTGDDKVIRVFEEDCSSSSNWGSQFNEVVKFEGHQDGVVGLCLLGVNRLVSVSHDNMIIIWDLESKSRLATLLGHTGSVFACCTTPDHQKIVSCSFDRSVKVWNVPSTQEKFTGHTGRLLGLAYSKDSRKIVTASRDKSLKIWDTQSHQVLCTLNGHLSNVFGCSFSPDMRLVASVSRDGSIRIWEALSGTCIRTLNPPSPKPKVKFIIHDCVFSPDGSQLVSVSDSKNPIIWNTTTWEIQATLYGHRQPVLCVAYSADGSRILTGSQDTTLKLWDGKTRRKLATLSGHKHSVGCCAFSPDGKTILSGGEDSVVIQWCAKTAKKLHVISNAHTAPIKGVHFSADGKRFITASTDSMAIMWDSVTKKEICSFACLSRITCAESSSLGNYFACGDGSGALYLLCPVGDEDKPVPQPMEIDSQSLQ